MKKELKDFIHLYLGCEVQYEGIINGAELKKEKKEHEHDIFYEPKVKAKKGLKVGVLKEITTNVTNTSIKSRIGRKGLQTHYGNGNFKLILRKLPDITKEEWNEIEEKSSIAPDAFGYYGIKDNFLIDTANTRFSWTIVNEILIELRKRSVDVDGLIESGLAIDSKTLKEKI